MNARWILSLPLAVCLSVCVPACAQAPAFYRDVLPILQTHCQRCHRPDEIGPMALVTYAETRPYAARIAARVAARTMPPWFADPSVGRFANDPSLSAAEIATLVAWARVGAPAGDPRQAPPPPAWTPGWNIAPPDRVFVMPRAVTIPATGDVDYTYEIVPTGFATDRWIRQAELRPGSRAHIHHAVVYIRPPSSGWLRQAPVGVPFTANTLPAALRRQALATDSDLLLVYAPGSEPDDSPPGMARMIPAGSDLVFQMHYTTNGHAASDRSRLGVVFATAPPTQRVVTLQLTNDRFVIPPGVSDYRVEVHGTLPQPAALLGFFPHMHLRGKRFAYNRVFPDGAVQPLLKVNYDFYWQLSYRLAHPLPLAAGAELQAEAWYDNSRANPHNPDPDSAVYWGDQTRDEMMVGFFDLAIPAAEDKWQFFVRN